MNISGLNGDLACSLAIQLVQSLVVVLDGINIGYLEPEVVNNVICLSLTMSYHSLDVDLAAFQVGDCTREAVNLREGADDLQRQPGTSTTDIADS